MKITKKKLAHMIAEATADQVRQQAQDYIKTRYGGSVATLCPDKALTSDNFEGRLRFPWMIDYLKDDKGPAGAAIVKEHADAAYNLIVELLRQLPNVPSEGKSAAALFATVAKMLAEKEQKAQQAKSDERNMEAGMFQEIRDILSDEISTLFEAE